MAEPTTIQRSSREGHYHELKEENIEKKKDFTENPEFFSCMLQPAPANSDPNYIGIRRFLLHRKAESGVLRRKDWRCNGKGYVAYRNYISRPRNWETLQIPSRSSTPGNSGRWMPSASPVSQLLESDSWNSLRDLRSPSQASQALSRTTSFSSIASDTDDRPRRRSEPAYSFVGMHCIFDQCKAMVTVIKFGHMSSDLLAYGASDGSLTVCSVSMPPSVIKQLIGHSKDVTDFDFSTNNQYIASSSMDKTVRVWDISRGLCIRVIYGVASQLCIRFHPVNNNFLSAGNAKKEINVFNFSTGRTIGTTVVDGEVTAMDHDHTGQFIFCGDDQGCIYTVSMNSHTGALSRTHRNRSSSKHRSAVTTIEYRTFSLMARGPVLLAFTHDGSLSFFSVSLEMKGYLTLRCSLKLAPRLHSIRASFCPLLSLEKGEYIGPNIVVCLPSWNSFSGGEICFGANPYFIDFDLSISIVYTIKKLLKIMREKYVIGVCQTYSIGGIAGSEDANVYFYDLTRPRNTCVNKLQGHGYPVIGIAWNHGENLLASSDFGGTVIVWKRAKTA